MTLTDFLLARIDEDEAVALNALHPDAKGIPGEWVTEHYGSQYHDEPDRCHIAEDRAGHYWTVAHEVSIPNAEHMARHDPARVLRECQAKRQLIERVGNPDWAGFDILALPYANHPDCPLIEGDVA